MGEEKDNKEANSMKAPIKEVRLKAASIMYLSESDKYIIRPYKDSWLKGRPVFYCIDECGYSVVLAKDDAEGWIRLSGGGDFSGMNKALKDYKLPKEKLSDVSALGWIF